MDSLCLLLIHYDFTIYFANSIWTHYLFREFTMNPLSISQIHYEPTIYLANSLWIDYLFQYCIYLLSIRRFTMNSLSFSWFHHKFIVYFVNSLGIYYIFFEFTLNQISISRVRYLSRENKMKTLSVSRFN